MGSTLATETDIAVTKQDIEAVTLATKQDIAAMRQEIAALASAMKQDFVLVRQEIQALRQEVGHRIDLLECTMTIRLGSITVVAMWLLFAALKLT